MHTSVFLRGFKWPCQSFYVFPIHLISSEISYMTMQTIPSCRFTTFWGANGFLSVPYGLKIRTCNLLELANHSQRLCFCVVMQCRLWFDCFAYWRELKPVITSNLNPKTLQYGERWLAMMSGIICQSVRPNMKNALSLPEDLRQLNNFCDKYCNIYETKKELQIHLN